MHGAPRSRLARSSARTIDTNASSTVTRVACAAREPRCRAARAARAHELSGVGAAARGHAQDVPVVRDLSTSGARAKHVGRARVARSHFQLDHAQLAALDDLVAACRRPAARRER